MTQPAGCCRIGGVAEQSANTAPTVPASLNPSAASPSQINLSWGGPTDSGSGVKGYNVYRNGIFLKQVAAPATTASDIGLAASTAYSYTVAAVDKSYNQSAQSTAASATTQSCGFSLSPTNASVASTGGSTNVAVTSTGGCGWTAASSASWVTITSGSSGTGNGSVNYSLAANTNTVARSAALTVAGQSVTVNQAAATSSRPANDNFTTAASITGVSAGPAAPAAAAPASTSAPTPSK